MTAPLVSLIVPVYNREKILAESVRSACAQTIKDIEIILVDNASTDNTWALCQTLARQDSRIRIFKQDRNTGPIGNWQRCMAEARGYFVKCVWSDDLIAPDSLEKTLPYLVDPTVGLVFNAARIFTNEGAMGEVLYAQHGDRPGTLSSDDYIRYMLYKQGATVPNSPVASLFRLKDLREAVLMEVPSPTIHDFPEHSMGTDVLAHLLVAQRYEKVAFVPEPMTLFRSHQDSITTWALNEASQKWTDCYQQVKVWFAYQYNRPIDLQYLVANEWIRRFTPSGSQVSLFEIAQQFLLDPVKAGIPQHGSREQDFRYVRQVVADFWVQVPDGQLAEIFNGEAGLFYRYLLQCGLNRQPLLPPEQARSQDLSAKIAQGFDRPGAIAALIAAMLYYPPGKMQVQNAAERLPAWLLPDYQAVFESPEALAAIAQRQPPTPSSAPAAAPTNLAEDMVFLNRMLGCANLYYIDPDEQSIVEELRPIRRQVAEFWLSVPNDRVEAVFQSEFGKRYRSLLQCGFQNEPLKEDETAFVQALGQRVAAGIEQPDGLKAFLGVMLYYPPGKMQVRDAATRLPSWLWPDYQAVFEVNRPEPLVPGTLPQGAIAQDAPVQNGPDPTVPPAIAPPPANTLEKLEDMVFLNRLLGLTNLYEIDPADTAIAAELREMRSQVTQLWLSIPDDRLEAVFNSEFGRRYSSYLRCGFQREALTPEETQTLQRLAQQVAAGLEKPAGVKAFLGAMMYYPPGKMKVSNAEQRLPAWLLPTYRAVFEEGVALPA